MLLHSHKLVWPAASTILLCVRHKASSGIEMLSHLLRPSLTISGPALMWKQRVQLLRAPW